MSTENNALNMEDFLRAVSDIQSLDIDNIREQLLQGLNTKNQNEGEDWMPKTNHIYMFQKREADRARRQLEEDQEFRKEYVKFFGETKINALQRMTEDLNSDVEQLQRETERLNKENRYLEEKKQKVLKEKADGLTRLSQQMENQVTHNNSNNPELNDWTRPNQIGEKYAELYDIQWTNAFEVLTQTSGHNDERAVEILLKVLIECYTFVIKRSEKQMNDLLQRISGDSTMQVGDEIKHHLKKARKLVDVGRASLLFKECERHINDSLGSKRLCLYEKEIKLYLIECFQLCWLMAIQEPPVVLGTETMYAQDVDLNLYTRCTRYGNRVNFVVWPPLFLHKSGPLLAKGVTQEIEKKSDETFMKQKYKIIRGGESRTGRIEQHAGDKQDLVRM
ncbi:hypothetical protein CHS0354_026347 [Potamilus streckersoni]|uniref:Mitochondria-eating protein C-terminal domain-containing protein n=1 Tax=Potamilus streckersoni TaxID=2493646 RepID=A0AAE0T2W1_9BIVA|nr:hypothetical protein CHS0354_026347 [Potamilus streckersoni]